MATHNNEYHKLRLSFHQGAATVSIDNRPINLLDRDLFRELRQVIQRLEED
jgi:enoyl-CoA hydratase/carnithine racemase